MEDFTPISALRETLENAMQRMRRGREPFEANVELQMEILKEMRAIRKLLEDHSESDDEPEQPEGEGEEEEKGDS